MTISNPAGWQEDGDSQGAQYDKILEMIAAIIQVNPDGTFAVGDILYADTTSTMAKLPKGTNGQFLQMGATIPSWVDNPVEGTHTLNFSAAAWHPLAHNTTYTLERPRAYGTTFPAFNAWFSDSASHVGAKSMFLDLSGSIPLLAGKTTTITRIDIRVDGGSSGSGEILGSYYADWDSPTGSAGNPTVSTHAVDTTLGSVYETVSWTNERQFTTDMTFFLVWKPATGTGYISGVQVTYTVA